ncbi:MAG TPA: VOC family protein [Thermoplasmata archaeon]|nr:VOC family protein [Thermoplasmata archaeon]
MKSAFAYTGIRVRDLDRAIDFFTRVMGMKLRGRVKPKWTQGEFANLLSRDGKHWLELNWYPEQGPVEGPFREGDTLDHLGFEVDDLDAALASLKEEGYLVKHGPFHGGRWHYAFVPVVDGLWLDVFHRATKPTKKRRIARPRKTRRRRG